MDQVFHYLSQPFQFTNWDCIVLYMTATGAWAHIVFHKKQHEHKDENAGSGRIPYDS